MHESLHPFRYLYRAWIPEEHHELTSRRRLPSRPTDTLAPAYPRGETTRKYRRRRTRTGTIRRCLGGARAGRWQASIDLPSRPSRALDCLDVDDARRDTMYGNPLERVGRTGSGSAVSPAESSWELRQLEGIHGFVHDFRLDSGQAQRKTL